MDSRLLTSGMTIKVGHGSLNIYEIIRMKRISLIQMRMGETGVVAEIQGGYGIRRRMNAMGIRVGKGIIKVSSQLWRGPVTVKVDNFQVAIGFGIAARIIVEVQ